MGVMRLFRGGLGGWGLLLAACAGDAGSGSGPARDGGGAGGVGAGASSGGAGTECKTSGDCPQTNCFGCPPNVCVNGRCTSATTGNGGITGSGGAPSGGGATATGGVAGTAACTGAVLVFAGDARCQAWLESNCCAELLACESDATCKNMVACINRCATPRGGACLDNCASTASPLLDDLGTCSKNAPPSGPQCAWP